MSGTSRKIISGISSSITVIAGTVMLASCSVIPPFTSVSRICFCVRTSKIWWYVIRLVMQESSSVATSLAMLSGGRLHFSITDLRFLN